MHESAQSPPGGDRRGGPSERTTRVLLALGVALLGALGSLLALRLVPPARHELGPAEIAVRGELGAGRSTLFIPPLGTISADTHRSPITFTIEVREVDPTALTDSLSTASGRLALFGAVEDDLRAAARGLAIRLVIGGLMLGAFVAAVLPHRRWWTLVSGAAGGVATVSVLLAVSAVTFDVQAFEQPRFTGALERAPQVIETVDRSVGGLAELSSRYTTAARRVSDLLALVAEPAESVREGATAILHISDVHSNPLGLEIAERLAAEFEVDAVLDTGDLTSFGAPVEAQIATLINDFDVPYIFVPGNHDSDRNRAAIARFDNVILLDGDTATVGDIDILGIGDPTFTADNETTTEQGNLLREERAARVAVIVEDARPDVLAVHDVRLALDSVGLVPLVTAGHTHERSLERIDGSLVLTVGSAGATGLGSFLVEADLPYDAEIIYFRDGEPVSLDYISLTGLGGDFQVERVALDDAEAEEP